MKGGIVYKNGAREAVQALRESSLDPG
jgi:hypothetical protein